MSSYLFYYKKDVINECPEFDFLFGDQLFLPDFRTLILAFVWMASKMDVDMQELI